MKIKEYVSTGRVATPLATVQPSTRPLELSIANGRPRKRHRRRVSLAVARGYFDLMRRAVDNARDSVPFPKPPSPSGRGIEGEGQTGFCSHRAGSTSAVNNQPKPLPSIAREGGNPKSKIQNEKEVVPHEKTYQRQPGRFPTPQVILTLVQGNPIRTHRWFLQSNPARCVHQWRLTLQVSDIQLRITGINRAAGA